MSRTPDEPREPLVGHSFLPPPGSAKRDWSLLIAGMAVTIAVIGGLYAGKQLVFSGAATTQRVGRLQNRYAQLQRARTTATAAYLGPFARDPSKGRQCGPEVRLMEGALRRTKPPIRKAKPSNCIGLATEKQIKTLQRRNDLPPTGIYGKRTHRALAPRYTKVMRAGLDYIAAKRLLALRTTTIGIVTAHAKAFEGRMQYCEYGSLSSCGRRFVWPPYPDVPRHTDCSGYATWVYYQSGLPDPNGNGFRGGFTGTLVTHGTPVRPNGPLHIGDLIFNGPSASNTTHVSVYVGHGLSSGHGRAGIQLHVWNYRTVVAVRRYF